MKLPKNSVITGLKALYLQNVISFNPEYIELRMSRKNTNVKKIMTSNHSFLIKTRAQIVYNLFTEVINDCQIYIKERLLVEIDTFKIDNTLYKQAIINLLKVCDYKAVDEIINSAVIKMQRIKPSQTSINFVKKMKIDFSAIPKTYFDQGMREYLMSRIYKAQKECIIKGGSAIEMYYPSKRATQDIDQYINGPKLKRLIASLQEKKDGIRFKIENFNKGDLETLDLGLGKRNHDRLKVTPVSSSSNIQRLINSENIFYMVDIEYDLDNIDEVINEYNLKPKKLEIINNRTALVLNRSMLFSEKIIGLLNSFHNYDEDAIRIKDYVDLLVISNNNEINISIAQKWLRKKIESKKYSYNYLLLYENWLTLLNSGRYDTKIKNTISTFNLINIEFNKKRTLNIIQKIITY